MTDQERWTATVAAIKARHPKFRVRCKDETWSQRALCKLMKPLGYDRVWTTLGRTVWIPVEPGPAPWKTLQHEWVHIEDATTLFGLMPKALWPLNLAIFVFMYAAPQLLALISLGAISGQLWWLTALAVLVPMVAPGRVFAELRAYRRSVELGSDPVRVADALASGTYFWGGMGLKRRIVKWLSSRPSPYMAMMDVTLGVN